MTSISVERPIISREIWRNLTKFKSTTNLEHIHSPIAEVMQFVAFCRDRALQMECTRCRYPVLPENPFIWNGFVYCDDCTARIKQAIKAAS